MCSIKLDITELPIQDTSEILFPKNKYIFDYRIIGMNKIV